MAKNRDRARSSRSLDNSRDDAREDSAHDEAEFASASDEAARELDSLARKRPRRMWPRFLVALIVTVGIAVAAAPTVISMTSLGPKLIASGAKDRIDGSLTVAAVRMGWFRAVSVEGAVLKDRDGETVAEIDSIRMSKGLLGLLSGMSDVGTIVIDRPRVRLELDRTSSNLEEILAPAIRQTSKSGGGTASSSSVAAKIEINQGEIELVERDYDKHWNLASLDARLELPANSAEPMIVEAAGKVDDGSFQVRFGVTNAPANDGGKTAWPEVEGELEAERFPLAIGQTAIERALGDAGMSGEFTGKVAFEIAQNGASQRLRLRDVELQKGVVMVERWFGKDAIEIDSLEARGEATLAKGVWDLKDLHVDSEVAKLQGRGSLALADLSKAGRIDESDIDVRGQIDLARLAKMLPTTLHIREGIEFTSGVADLSLRTEDSDAGRSLIAKVTANHLAASAQGKPIQWDQPITFEAGLRQEGEAWVAENAKIDSSFLKAQGSGSATEGKLTLQGDLDQLVTEIEQIVDLADVRMAGQFSGKATWSVEDRGGIGAEADLTLEGVEVAVPGFLPWRENELGVQVRIGGLRVDGANVGLASGEATVTAGNDKFEANLAEGVANVSPETPLPIGFLLQGDLETWAPRLQAFVPLKGWRLSGPISIRGEALASADRIQVSQGELTAETIEILGQGIAIREPRLQAKTNFVWDAKTGAITTPSTSVLSSTVNVVAQQLTIQTKPGEGKITGDVSMRANVGKLSAWFQNPRQPATGRLRGEAEMQTRFNHAGGTTKASIVGKITQFAYETAPPQSAPVPGAPVRAVSAARWTTVWTEPQATFGADAVYDSEADSLNLQKLDLRAGPTAIRAQGDVRKLLSQCLVDLAGDVEYDLADLTTKLGPYIGDMATIEGQGKRPFTLQGPLFEAMSAAGARNGDALVPTSLAATAGLAWDRANVMSFPIGAGELAADLKESIVDIAPLELPIGDGMLRASPRIILKGPDWGVAQQQVQLIDHVTITPEMCDKWLVYVAPWAAAATRAEGQFSVDLDEAFVPMRSPLALDAKGTFTVHKVSIGPGPLAQQLIGLATQAKQIAEGNYMGALGALAGGASPDGESSAKVQWLQLPEQQIPVDVADGRVRHENLRMQVKDIVIRTSGSVGLVDQTIELVAEVPILDAWLKKPELRTALKGQSIKVPIRGTVTRPQIDGRAMLDFQKQIAASAVNGALQGQIDKGVNSIGKKFGLPGLGGGASASGNPAESAAKAVQQGAEKGADMVEQGINTAEEKIQKGIDAGLKKIFGR